MKNILTLYFLSIALSASAQQHENSEIGRLISDKSFVFVSTASFSKIKPVLYNSDEEARSLTAQIHPGPPPILIKDRINDTRVNLLSRSANSPTISERFSAANTSKVPLLAIDNEGALFDISVVAPTVSELLALDEAELSKPLAFSNYSAKSKKGKWVVRFDVQDEQFKRNVILKVSPDGQADLSIASTIMKHNSGKRSMKYYKGYITGMN